DFMGPDVKDDVEVAGRASAQAGFAVAGRPQARAGVDAGGEAKGDLGGALAPPGATAGFAWVVDGFSGAVALRAGLGNAEDAARGDDLAATAATRANPGPRTAFGSGSVACLTAIKFRDRDLLLGAMGGFLEGDFHVIAQVVPALGLRG